MYLRNGPARGDHREPIVHGHGRAKWVGGSAGTDVQFFIRSEKVLKGFDEEVRSCSCAAACYLRKLCLHAHHACARICKHERVNPKCQGPCIAHTDRILHAMVLLGSAVRMCLELWLLLSRLSSTTTCCHRHMHLHPHASRAPLPAARSASEPSTASPHVAATCIRSKMQ